MRRLMPALWLPVLAALLALWVMGCDYTGYGAQPLPEDGDESDGDVPDGDVPDGDEPQITGAGSCADPFIPGSGQTTLTGSGELADLENTVTGSSCLADDTAVAAYMRVDGDEDDELDAEVETEVEVEVEAEIDGDTELEAEVEAEVDGDVDAEAEVEVDGDVDADAEADGEENLSCLDHVDCPVGYSCIGSESTCGLDANAAACTDTSSCEPGYECETMTDSTDKKCVPMEMTDGDLDDETTEGEIPEPLASGLGPEAVVKLQLSVGDTVNITYTPTGYDALFYVLGTTCEDSAACLWPGNDVVNDAGVGEAETIQFVSTIDGVVFVALDSTAADADGSYTYEITITSDEGGTPPEAGKVGAACTDDGECDTDYCLTSDVLKALLQTDIPIPKGYCSTVDLFVGSCADGCTEENGGFCIGGGFMGEDYAIVNLCLRPCETNGDCRIEDEQVCLDPQYWVDQGWITEETRTEFFGENKACLPTAFIAVMEEEMQLSSGN